MTNPAVLEDNKLPIEIVRLYLEYKKKFKDGVPAVVDRFMSAEKEWGTKG